MQNARLTDELSDAKPAAQQASSGADPLYARVGLLGPDTPDFVILAARRAYRLALHPDKHRTERKAEAHRRFVAAEQAFDSIYQLRGL